MFIANKGEKLYIISDGDDSVYQYTLSTPYDISTANQGESWSKTTGTRGGVFVGGN